MQYSRDAFAKAVNTSMFDYDDKCVDIATSHPVTLFTKVMNKNLHQ